MKWVLFAILFAAQIALASEAIDKAVQAATIQTGLQADADKFTQYVLNECQVRQVPCVEGAFVFRTIRDRTIRLRTRRFQVQLERRGASAQVTFHF